ncbi:hypothetical protein M8J77_018664 [Diaphorina citri]|nr:hypothetical protein M8J77_018664 [Diaphorina citri]
MSALCFIRRDSNDATTSKFTVLEIGYCTETVHWRRYLQNDTTLGTLGRVPVSKQTTHSITPDIYDIVFTTEANTPDIHATEANISIVQSFPGGFKQINRVSTSDTDVF